MKYRYFPFLGFKTLSDEEADLFDLDLDFTYKALLFEWFDFSILLLALGTLRNTNAD